MVAVFIRKTASDIYSPAAGEITEVNSALLDDLTSITPESAMKTGFSNSKSVTPLILKH